MGDVVPPDSEGSISKFQPENENTINLTLPLGLVEVSTSSAVINSINDTPIYTDTSFI